MSRLGRNYLQVGFYTEMLFPEKGVRFIAVNNNIDSDNPTENEFTPFLNIMKNTPIRERESVNAPFSDGSGRINRGFRCSCGKSAIVHGASFVIGFRGISLKRIQEFLSLGFLMQPGTFCVQNKSSIKLFLRCDTAIKICPHRCFVHCLSSVPTASDCAMIGITTS